MSSGDSLRSAIAHSQNLCAEYAAMRNRLYDMPIWAKDKKSKIAYNEKGEAIGKDGRPIVPEFIPVRFQVPSLKALGNAPLPEGMVTAAGIAEEYQISMHTLADYQRKWEYEHPTQVKGYAKIEGKRKDGSACAHVEAYYDPEEFRLHLLNLQATEGGAQRMLANVGIGEYHQRRGMRHNRSGGKV